MGNGDLELKTVFHFKIVKQFLKSKQQNSLPVDFKVLDIEMQILIKCLYISTYVFQIGMWMHIAIVYDYVEPIISIYVDVYYN